MLFTSEMLGTEQCVNPQVFVPHYELVRKHALREKRVCRMFILQRVSTPAFRPHLSESNTACIW
jgi:hypothetical protein